MSATTAALPARPLTLAGLRAWLEPLEPDTIVGLASDPWLCPLAVYAGSGTVSYGRLCTETSSEAQELPAPLVAFYQALDTWAELPGVWASQGGELQAWQALTVVERLEEPPCPHAP